MARKILISFSDQLIIDYLIKNIYTEWYKGDCIYILSTKEKDEASIPPFITHDTRLSNIIPVYIPKGRDEEEIWEIFQIIYSVFKEKDEVNIDISYCPRIIEMLLASLIQYAKLLKNISVNGVYYCVSCGDSSCNHIDLKAFSDILDWGIAANDIINFGNADKLDMVTSAHIHPVLKKTCGQDDAALKLKKLNTNIKNLSLNIRTNRGKSIIEGENAENILSTLEQLEQDLILPLNPILKRIKTSVEQMYRGKNEKENMLAVVQWCIDKSLIQEGYTLLQEGIISHFLGDHENKTKREITSAYLNHRSRGTFDITMFSETERKHVEEIQDSLESFLNMDEWAVLYSQLTELRNDINHGGMTESPFSFKHFETKLQELYFRTMDLTNDQKNG